MVISNIGSFCLALIVNFFGDWLTCDLWVSWSSFLILVVPWLIHVVLCSEISLFCLTYLCVETMWMINLMVYSRILIAVKYTFTTVPCLNSLYFFSDDDLYMRLWSCTYLGFVNWRPTE